MKKSTQPPAKKRYDARHPVVSFRASEYEYQRLKSVLAKEKKTIAQFFREALAVERRNYQDAKEQGYREGFKDAKEKYGVTVTCISCFDDFYLTSQKLRDEAGSVMSNKYGMLHQDCSMPPRDDPARMRRSSARRRT